MNDRRENQEKERAAKLQRRKRDDYVKGQINTYRWRKKRQSACNDHRPESPATIANKRELLSSVTARWGVTSATRVECRTTMALPPAVPFTCKLLPVGPKSVAREPGSTPSPQWSVPNSNRVKPRWAGASLEKGAASVDHGLHSFAFIFNGSVAVDRHCVEALSPRCRWVRQVRRLKVMEPTDGKG